MTSPSQEQHFEERAAIFEYDAGMSRPEAEMLAFLHVYGESALCKLNEQEWFEERAAIFEYDARMSRERAEALAHDLVFNNGELFNADKRNVPKSFGDSESSAHDSLGKCSRQRQTMAACF